ncbi:MAG: DUF6290 family protein [Desulfovibrio sp.]|nr:DUF6290 family protein [Desulfovibrio sp.]
MLTLRLPADIENRLTYLAQATGRNKSFYAKEAILTHLENLEDNYPAEKDYKQFKSSNENSLPLEEVMKEYGLES